MKKLILNFLIGISLCANAQLTVLENGQTVIGDPSSLTKVYSGAALNIWNTNPSSGNWGTISFGEGSKARISGRGTDGSISIYANKDFNLYSLDANELVFQWNANVRTFYHKYDLIAPTYLTLSDARLKTNVSSLSDTFCKLQDVNAVSYNLSASSSSDASFMAEKDSKVKDNIKDDRTHFGFIAQEIQEIFPNLVVEDEAGLLAVDYTGFIPLLVEAYKDLSNKVKEQEDIIMTLTRQRGPSFMPASVNGVAEQNAVLKQNKPNPFNSSTSIECTLPENIASAFLCVYDLQGKQVYRIDIRERGDVVNVIDASYFAPGMYIYSLITDGVEVDSKRMIITD
ncbi:MAG: tail fiber domain-containing protein [Muribaculaceae bacterium]|nr:tail fiber domain-containing protein [Muribaculaceae bacterium]